MAYVIKKPGHKKWIAVISVPGRSKTQRSTGIPLTEPRKTAEAVAQALEDEQRKALGPIDPAIFAEKAVARILFTAGKEHAKKNVSWRAWVAQWLEELKASDGTRTKYAGDAGKLTTWLGKRADEPMRSITHTDCSSWYSSLLESGRAVSTANGALKLVTNVFADALKHKLIDSNPCDLVKRETKGAGIEKQPFTRADLTKIFAQLEKENHAAEWRIGCLFALLYGMRLHDAFGRDYGEIREDEGIRVLTFIPMKKRRKGKAVSLPLVPPLDTLTGTGPITPGVMSIQNLSKVFARILRDAGVAVSRTNAKGAGYSVGDKTFHSFRHTCNTALANAGVDVRIRQLVSDHESEAMNARYTHPALESMASAVRSITATLGL